MCIFLEDDDDDSGDGNSGSARLQWKRHHTWLVPRRGLLVIFVVAIFFFFVGMLLMAIGGGVGSTALNVIGGLMFAVAIICLLVCLFVCCYAYFFYGTKDQSVQTETQWNDDFIDSPGYASIGRPSALKSPDSTLKRNGAAGQKKVTMAPDVGHYGESPPNSVMSGGRQDGNRNFVGYQGSVGGGSGTLTRPGDGGVGSGGIRITPVDGGPAFPSPVYQTAGSGSFTYAGVGNSGQESGFSETSSRSYRHDGGSLDGSVSGAQYSTIKTIPVTHIVENPNHQTNTVEYARVNKPSRNAQAIPVDNVGHQQNFVVTSVGNGSSQSFSSAGNVQQRFPVSNDDFDYDNTVETAPMIPPKQSHLHNRSYHEQQMQYQRQQATLRRQQQNAQGAPRPTHIQLQQDYARSPQHQQQVFLIQGQQYQQGQQHNQQQHQQYHHQQQQELQHQLQQQQAQQQQQQQSQQMHYQTKQSSSSRKVVQGDDDLPEPQPLVYPSARRPMTFEQVSSSKMSMYDNVLSGFKEEDEDQ